jgi:hypothetical protein
MPLSKILTEENLNCVQALDLYPDFEEWGARQRERDLIRTAMARAANRGDAMTTAAAITFGFWIGVNLGFLLGGFVCLWGRTT